MGEVLWLNGSLLLPTLRGVAKVEGRSLKVQRRFPLRLEGALCLALTTEGFIARDDRSRAVEVVRLEDGYSETQPLASSSRCDIEMDQRNGILYTFGRSGVLVVGFDFDSLDEVTRLTTSGSDPNWMDLDPSSGRIFVVQGSRVVSIGLTSA
jgi:hypothetical protein